MSTVQPPRGLLGNEGNHGEDVDNLNFWQALKAQYIDHPDDCLLLAIVRNEIFNEDLKLTQFEEQNVAPRKHVLVLAKLRAPAPGVALPIQLDSYYINFQAV